MVQTDISRIYFECSDGVVSGVIYIDGEMLSQDEIEMLLGLLGKRIQIIEGDKLNEHRTLINHLFDYIQDNDLDCGVNFYTLKNHAKKIGIS